MKIFKSESDFKANLPPNTQWTINGNYALAHINNGVYVGVWDKKRQFGLIDTNFGGSGMDFIDEIDKIKESNAINSQEEMKLLTELLDLQEMATRDEMSSGGFGNKKRSRGFLRDFVNGHDVLTIKDKDYINDGRVPGNKLKKGMLVLATYDKSNQGVDPIEILGFSDNKDKYGDSGVKFDSIEEVFKSCGVTSLHALEELEDINEHGYATYMWARDMNDDDEGGWYYLHNGRWCRGSGAEPLTFYKLKADA